MATETITSTPSSTPVGSSGKKLETYTQTTYSIDSNGKIDPKSRKTEILYNNSTIPGVKNWVPAAASTDGGKTWDTTSKRYQKLDGTPVFGADAQKSLKEGALKTTTNQQVQTAATKAKIPPEQQKVLSDAAKNNASTTTNPDRIEQVSLKIEGSGNQRDKAGSFGNYRYPEKLAYKKQDTVKFTMLKYQPRQIAKVETYKGGDLGGFQDRSTDRIILGTVVLPVPSGISETNSADWGSQTMGAGDALAANVALKSISEGLGAGAGVVAGAATNAAGAGNAEVKAAVTTGFAEAATGVGNLLSRTQGAIFNPNMELLFNGPTLRPFSFTFKLSARSGPEAKQIIQIIRFFKQGMSPQKSQSNLYLKAPHTFKIQYTHLNKDHPFIGAIKECALQSFSVDYTPEGQYATFKDGVMVSYQITMQFQELEPVFNEDYGKDGDLPSDLLFREAPTSKQ